MICDDVQQDSLPDYVKSVLPLDNNPHICSFKEHSNGKLDIELRLPTNGEQEARQWIADMENVSFTTWRTSKTFPHVYPANSRSTNIFKQEFKCQHNVGKPGRKTKNTKCPSHMTIIIKRICGFEGRHQSRSKDPHIPMFPTTVKLSFQHNHTIQSAAALRYRDVRDSTRQKLEGLFRNGHNPATALNMLKYDLQVEHGDEYMRIAGDRAMCPDINYCTNLYRRISRKPHGESPEEDKLSSKMESYSRVMMPHSTENVAVNDANTPHALDDDDAIKKQPTEAEITELLAEFTEVGQEICAKLVLPSGEPCPVYCDALRSFVHSYKMIKTEAALHSALYNFGKYELAASVQSSQNQACIGRLKRRSQIGVRPTARRKSGVAENRKIKRAIQGRGKLALISGHPVGEHQYSRSTAKCLLPDGREAKLREL